MIGREKKVKNKRKILLVFVVIALSFIGVNQLLNQKDIQNKVKDTDIVGKDVDELSGKLEVDNKEILSKAEEYPEYLTESVKNELISNFTKVTEEEKKQIKKQLLLDSLLLSTLEHQFYSIFKNDKPEKIQRTIGLSGFETEVTSHENNGEVIEIIKIDETQSLQIISSLYEIDNNNKISGFRLYDKEKGIYYEPDEDLSSLLTNKDGRGLITYQVPKDIKLSNLYEEIQIDDSTFIGEYFTDDKFFQKETK